MQIRPFHRLVHRLVHRCGLATLSATAVLLAAVSGCGDEVQENKDLQMNRRQVDTYGETPVTEPAVEPLVEPVTEPGTETIGGDD